MSDDQPRLGKYEILRTLGRGAMGVVYEGIDRVIERRVAIKTVRTEDLDADEAEEHLRRFLIEARAAGKLNHPHIVSLYDHGEQDGTAYLVMELVVGRELQQWFDDGHRYPLGETVRLMGELLAALGYSHRQGVIHRDVKPANIFITEAGSLKLGDFGIARIESQQKTRAGLAIGTPTHMAPEQIRGETADARSDLYAAGVVLFQLLTGTRPFSGTMLTMALKVLNQPAPLASSVNPQVTPALDAVVAKALAKTADSRFQSAEEFWLALQQATQQGLDSMRPPQSGALADVDVTDSRLPAVDDSSIDLARQAAVTVISSRLDAAAPSSAAPTPAASANSTNSRMPIWLIAGGSLAALIAAAWWWRIGQPAPPPPEEPPTARPRDEVSAPSTKPSTPPAPDARAIAGPPRSVAPDAARPPADPPAMPAAPAAPASPPPTVAKRATAPAPAPAPTPTATQREAQTTTVRDVAPAPPAPTQTATAAPPAARAPLPVRCSDILMKASLEPLTTEESRYLRKECQ